jgi:hypothetical protein
MQFASDDIADYDAMVELEGRLIEGLGDDHVVDGHDVGSGEINIFIHTNDPNAAYARVKGLLSASQQKTVKIAFRGFESEEYTVLWPHNEKSFNIA